VGEGYVEAFLAVIVGNIRRDSLPSFLLVGKDSEHWLQSSFIKFSLVVHVFDGESKDFSLGDPCDIEVEPSSIVAAGQIRLGIF